MNHAHTVLVLSIPLPSQITALFNFQEKGNLSIIYQFVTDSIEQLLPSSCALFLSHNQSLVNKLSLSSHERPVPIIHLEKGALKVTSMMTYMEVCIILWPSPVLTQ